MEYQGSDRKTMYGETCELAGLPFYMHPWWLDIVCSSGIWDVLFSTSNDGQVQAVFPFFLTRYRATRAIINPLFTPHLGIYYLPKYKPSNPTKSFSWENNVCSELIKALPGHGYFQMKFHSSFQNWLPLRWLGFRQSTLYTSVLYPETPDSIFKKFSKGLQQDIRKAENYLTLRTDAPFEIFLDLNIKTFKYQGKTKPYDTRLVKKIDQVLAGRDLRKIYTAYNINDPVASIYIVRDKNKHIYLMSGRTGPRTAVALLACFCGMLYKMPLNRVNCLILRGATYREFNPFS